jgi:cold shock CspA family protein
VFNNLPHVVEQQSFGAPQEAHEGTAATSVVVEAIAGSFEESGASVVAQASAPPAFEFTCIEPQLFESFTGQTQATQGTEQEAAASTEQQSVIFNEQSKIGKRASGLSANTEHRRRARAQRRAGNRDSDCSEQGSVTVGDTARSLDSRQSASGTEARPGLRGRRKKERRARDLSECPMLCDKFGSFFTCEGVSVFCACPSREDSNTPPPQEVPASGKSKTLQQGIPPSHWVDHTPKLATCPHCTRAKMTFAPTRRVPVSERAAEKATTTGERLIGDLAGPFPTAVRGERMLFVCYDEKSELLFAFPLAGKTPGGVKAALLRIRLLLRYVRQETGELTPAVWIFKADQGGEFTALTIRDWLAEEHGVYDTVPTGRHVAGAERTVRTVCEGVRTLLSAGGLPAPYWGFAAVLFAWNHNLQHSEGWRKMCERRRFGSEERIFGELCWVKLLEDTDQGLSKADTRGRPAAFLSWALDARKGAYVLALGSDGKYRTVMVDRSGIAFEGPDAEGNVQFGFKRVFSDLIQICAPGEAIRSAGGQELDRYPQKVEPLKPGHVATHAPDDKTPPKGNPLSACPRCRGRENKSHSYQGTGPTACRFSGLTTDRLKDCRGLVRQAPQDRREGLIEDAARRINAGASWQAARLWLIEQVARIGNADPDQDNEAEGLDPEAANPASHTCTITNSDVAFMNKMWDAHCEVSRAERRVRRASRRHRAPTGLSKGARAAFGVTPEGLPTRPRHRGRDKRSPETREAARAAGGWKAFSRDHTARVRAIQEARNRPAAARRAARTRRACMAAVSALGLDRRAGADAGIEVLMEELKSELVSDFDAELENAFATAMLTRTCTKAERNSAEGINARREEFRKVCSDYGAFVNPQSREAALTNDPECTISDLHCLTSVKHAEKVESLQKYKGRLVLLGNNVRRMLDGKQVFPSASAFGIHGDVASLAAFRYIVAHSLQGEYALETADLTSAYLNCPWPEGVPKHYVRLTPEMMSFLPADLQAAAAKVGPGAVFEMAKCLYGHSMSGHFWIDMLMKFLQGRGWKPIPGVRALLQRGNTVMCCYVDDLCISGPPAEVAQVWDELGSEFQIGAQSSDSVEFLGIRVDRSVEGDTRIARFSQGEYASEIVRTYAELWPERRQWTGRSDTPLLDELRTDDQGEPSKNRVLKIIGMCLWLSRCTRPDLAHACSRLGSRVSRWNEACEKELQRLVNFIQSTAEDRLEYRHIAGEKLETVIFTDANLSSPRSQSCFILLQRGEQGSCCVIDWGSTRQPLCADSTAASELIAGHYGVRESLPLARFASGGSAIKLLIDNAALVRLIRRGTPQGLAHFEGLSKPLRLRTGLLHDLEMASVIDSALIPSRENLSDIGTKALGAVVFTRLRSCLGLRSQASRPCSSCVAQAMGRRSERSSERSSSSRSRSRSPPAHTHPKRHAAKIVTWFPDKSFGFAQSTSGDTQFFVHSANLRDPGESQNLQQGCVLSFTADAAEKGKKPKATDITITERPRGPVATSGQATLIPRPLASLSAVPKPTPPPATPKPPAGQKKRGPPHPGPPDSPRKPEGPPITPEGSSKQDPQGPPCTSADTPCTNPNCVRIQKAYLANLSVVQGLLGQ